jgi:hypothetical protein
MSEEGVGGVQEGFCGTPVLTSQLCLRKGLRSRGKTYSVPEESGKVEHLFSKPVQGLSDAAFEIS